MAKTKPMKKTAPVKSRNAVSRPAPKPAARPAEPVATGTLGQKPPIVLLNTFEEITKFAETLFASGFAPPAFKNAAAIAMAIMKGSELGLWPMQAISMIVPMRGRLTLNADGVVAVIMASGKAEYFYPGTVNDKTATFITKRKGDPKEHSYTFTMEQAKTAGLLNNPVYKTYPSRMLSARAKSYLGRDIFADVVGGIMSTEEAAALPGPEDEPSISTFASGDKEADAAAEAALKAKPEEEEEEEEEEAGDDGDEETDDDEDESSEESEDEDEDEDEDEEEESDDEDEESEDEEEEGEEEESADPLDKEQRNKLVRAAQAANVTRATFKKKVGVEFDDVDSSNYADIMKRLRKLAASAK